MRLKPKRLILFGVVAVLLIAYAVSIAPNFRRRTEWRHAVSALQSLPRDRMDEAVHACVRDRKAHGSAAPKTLSLNDLINGGYLRSNEVGELSGMDATFPVAANETNPDSTIPRDIVACVRLSDGSKVIELFDGSIQMSTR